MHDSFVLVGLDEVVDKISIEETLNDSSYEWGEYDILPMEYPELSFKYQWQM